MIEPLDDQCPTCGCPTRCAEGTYEQALEEIERLRATLLRIAPRDVHQRCRTYDIDPRTWCLPCFVHGALSASPDLPTNGPASQPGDGAMTHNL